MRYEISNLLKISPRGDAMLQKIQEDLAIEYLEFCAPCPTRCTVRGESLKSVLNNWIALQSVWEKLVDQNMELELRGRIIGVKSEMNTFNYFHGFSILELGLRHSGRLSRHSKSLQLLLVRER